MALSGNFTTSAYSGRYYKFSWTGTQDVANNRTKISWTISCAGGSSEWYAERDLELQINNSVEYTKTARVERKAGTVATGTCYIGHNTDGTKSFSASLKVAVYGNSINCTGSKTFTLDTIARQATITSAPNFTSAQAPVISYSNPAGTAVTSLQACISLDGSKDDIAYRDIPKNGSSYTFSLTAAEMNVLRKATSGKSRTVKFFVRSIIGGVTYRSSLSRTFTIADGAPSLTCSVYDNNTATVALTGDSSKFIKGYSNAYYSMSATAATGASISSYSCMNSGIKQNNKSGTFNKVNSADFYFNVTDSRGNTTSQTVSKTLIDYFAPTYEVTTSLSVDGTLSIVIRGNYYNGSFGNTNNTIQLGIKTWASDTEEPEKAAVYTPFSEGNSFDIQLDKPFQDYGKTYYVYTYVVDKLVTVSNETVRVSSTPVFDWGRDDFKFNVPVEMAHAKGIKTYDTNGNLIEILMPCGDGNNLHFNYGNYSKGQGTTNIYGNSIELHSNNPVTINNDVDVIGELYADSLNVNGKMLGEQSVLHTDSGRFMHETQSINLSSEKRIVNQFNGYILVWQYISGSTVYTENINYTYVPKCVTKYANGKITLPVHMDNGTHGSKTLFVTDDGSKTTIIGHTANDAAPNNQWVLKYIYSW